MKGKFEIFEYKFRYQFCIPFDADRNYKENIKRGKFEDSFSNN